MKPANVKARGLTIRSSRRRFVPAKSWQREPASFFLHYAARLNSGVRAHTKVYGETVQSTCRQLLSHCLPWRHLVWPFFMWRLRLAQASHALVACGSRRNSRDVPALDMARHLAASIACPWLVRRVLSVTSNDCPAIPRR